MEAVPITDILWVLASSVLVLLMQGGFLCLESGFTRSKNAINVALKNASDFLLATLVWFTIGFGLMFGESYVGVVGITRFLPELGAETPWTATFFIFQMVFCATAATIVSGAVAERMRFNGYHIVTLVTVALIYPVYGHWAWGGVLGGEPGWLSALGFIDFAGSTVVHSIGGWVALVAVLIIGPRIGRFDGDDPRPIPGSNLPLAMLGVILFLVGWIGFNGGSTLGLTADVPGIIVNTLLSGAAGGVAAYLALQRFTSPDLDTISVPLNGVIAGLVAITASCHVVTSAQSVLIGACGGLLVVVFTDVLARYRIDDAIGVIPVHLVAGIWGTLAVGLFGSLDKLGTGLSRAEQIGVQVLGVGVAGVWAFGATFLLLALINRHYPLRVGSADEKNGLNVSEHGAKTELIELMTAMQAQAESKDLALRVPVEPFTEVGLIATQHNQLMTALEQAEARSQSIVRDLRDGIITFDHNGLLTSINPGAENIFSVTASDVLNRPVCRFFGCNEVAVPEALRSPNPSDEAMQELVEQSPWELSLTEEPSDKTHYVELALTRDSDHDGHVTCLVRDITDRRLVESALFEEKELAQTTLESIADGVITTDAGGRIVYLNAIAAELTGWSLDGAIGQQLHRVFPVVDSPTEMPSSWIVERVLRDEQTVIEAKSRLLYCRDGNVHAVQHTAAPIRNQSGRITGLVVVFHDMTQARAMERQLTHQAKHDGLTGLINRREFENRLGELFEQLHDGPAEHLLCYLDLDQFKLVNDVCGHTAGDALLRQIGSLLKRGLRSSDTIARLGGDEFGIILTHCSIDRGIEMAEALRERVHNFRFSWSGKQFAVGVSVGLVPLSRSLGRMADALSRADAACYAAKDTGRNRVHVYDPDDRELALRQGQMKWATRIQRALDENRFRLFQQTIAPVNEARDISGYFEVLLRMTDDHGKDIPPGAFIPAAERYGLMPEIDRWVVRHTLDWLSNYKKQGGHAIYRCSINLSGATLGNDKHTQRIREYLDQCDIDPELICFEITETAAVANLEQANHFISELKRTGCRFALDDFGSGLSSFGYLKELDVDFLKIDGAFIKDIGSQEVDRAMVEAITGIARVMGLKTIAEFVEDNVALNILREIGVDYAQGYHIARPKPLSDFPLPVSNEPRTSASGSG